jgi:periplasmic protein TonB
MNESSVRAERFERDAPVLPSYTWAVPQKPVAVRIPLDLMEKLERETVENYRSLTSRGSEIGGVLFGAITPGTPAVVEIESYESVPCEYATGPLYRLAEPELTRLDHAIGQKRAAGVEPVGFFRSHTRKGLCLDAGDLALLDSRFAGPHQIALVIRPSATKASIGGIFIRENGAVRGEATYLEFPLHGVRENSGASEGEFAGPRAVPAVPAVPAAARPVARAQIVPIATRREIMPMSPPTVVAAPPEPLPAEPVRDAPEASVEAPAEPERQTATPRMEAPAARVDTAVPAPAATATPAEPAVRVQKTEPAAASDGRPAERDESGFHSFEPPAPRRSGKWLWLGIGAGVPALLAAGFFLSSGVLSPRRPAVPAAGTDAGLALRIERNAGDILLTWNRDADAIRRATRAVLSISDGAQQENVEMDLSQLRTGSIVYSPVTSDVVFRMQVTGNGQAEPVSETVRVLRTRPSPMPDATANTTVPGPTGARPAAAPAAGSTEQPGAEPANAPAEEKVALAQPVKTFRPEALAQRLRAARPTEIPDAPLVAGTPTGAGVPEVSLGGLMPNPVAPPPPAPKGEPAKKTAVTGGDVQPAQLLRRVSPDFPKLARDAGANGTVELVATIGTDGHVRNVRALTGNPLLRGPAMAAVKQWVYRPTILNGQPVESETRVLLEFKNMR